MSDQTVPQSEPSVEFLAIAVILNWISHEIEQLGGARQAKRAAILNDVADGISN